MSCKSAFVLGVVAIGVTAFALAVADRNEEQCACTAAAACCTSGANETSEMASSAPVDEPLPSFDIIQTGTSENSVATNAEQPLPNAAFVHSAEARIIDRQPPRVMPYVRD